MKEDKYREWDKNCSATLGSCIGNRELENLDVSNAAQKPKNLCPELSRAVALLGGLPVHRLGFTANLQDRDVGGHGRAPSRG